MGFYAVPLLTHSLKWLVLAPFLPAGYIYNASDADTVKKNFQNKVLVSKSFGVRVISVNNKIISIFMHD